MKDGRRILKDTGDDGGDQSNWLTGLGFEAE